MRFSSLSAARIISTFAVLALAAVMLAATPQSASAGIFRFLFGKNNANNVDWDRVSGKQRVPFSREYALGTVVVSFSDRRLYFISEPGVAISYPVGTPTGEARWSGISHVSRKVVNPKWTPTPDMRRENPELPVSMPGGHPYNPLGPRAPVEVLVKVDVLDGARGASAAAAGRRSSPIASPCIPRPDRACGKARARRDAAGSLRRSGRASRRSRALRER